MKINRLACAILGLIFMLGLQGCDQNKNKTLPTNKITIADFKAADDADKSLNETKTKAENGDMNAQRELGFDYKLGFGGVAQNDAEAAKWLRKAAENARQTAERGDARSQNMLGEAYRNGWGVAQDDKEAFNWFSKAADQSNAAAEVNIGESYRDGKGVARNDTEAVKWFQKSAGQSNILAQFNLGLMYELGRGVTQNSDEAMKWFQLSAKYSQSKIILEAYKGNMKVQAKVGSFFYNGDLYPEDHVEAAKWYRMAALGGDVKSQNKLASMYYEGDGVPKNMTEAAKWYRMAADKDNASALGRLGMMYLTADGVERNYSEAFKLCSKAAEKGDESGLQGLTICYEGGFGAPVDYAKAAEITRRLAETGKNYAQRNLGMDYEQGQGVSRDFIEAYKWYNLAAANEDDSTVKVLKKSGLETASTMRGRLAQQMTPEQIAEGQRRAAAFISRKEASGSSSDNSISSDNPTATGTGFFITDDGYLISNYHVVKGAAKVRLLTGAGLIDATVVKVDAANDLALLKAAGRFAPLPIAASRTVKLGATVATVGFPSTGLQGFSPKLAKGEIGSLAGAADDPRYFQISVPVQPGNSGGALVDARGNVVGIVSAKLSAKAALDATGTLPENVNYAVKSSLLLSFLESVPDVAAKLKEPLTAERKFEDVVKSAQDAAVLVLVY